MVHYYPDMPSGSSRLAYDEGVYLSSLGHEVWFVSPRIKPNTPEYKKEGLQVF